MKPARILITEDEAIIARDIERELTQMGYEVSGIASSGEEAIERAKESPPDLALMDIRLQGGMDGVQAARYLRDFLQIPILFLTSYTDEKTVERAGESDPLGYLVKPFTPRELGISIQIALQRFKEEVRLSKNVNRMQMAMDCCQGGIWDMNLLTHQMYVSSHLIQWLGLKHGGERKNSEAFEILFDTKDKDRIVEVILKHLDNPSSYFCIDHRVKDEHGHYKSVRSYGRVIKDDDGNPIRMMGMMIDLSETPAQRKAA